MRCAGRRHASRLSLGLFESRALPEGAARFPAHFGGVGGDLRILHRRRLPECDDARGAGKEIASRYFHRHLSNGLLAGRLYSPHPAPKPFILLIDEATVRCRRRGVAVLSRPVRAVAGPARRARRSGVRVGRGRDADREAVLRRLSQRSRQGRRPLARRLRRRARDRASRDLREDHSQAARRHDAAGRSAASRRGDASGSAPRARNADGSVGGRESRIPAGVRSSA